MEDTLRDSIAGYLAKIIMRNKRTILVEGSSDIGVLNFLIYFIQDKYGGAEDLLIDSVEMIKSDGVILSNREKVELLHSQINSSSKCAAFVDREFREFDENRVLDLLKCHSTKSGSCFWTRGHSVENYFFEVKSLIRFVELWCPDLCQIGLKKSLESHTNAILKAAALVSMAARASGTIERASGIASSSHWLINSKSEIEFNYHVFSNDLKKRGSTKESIEKFDGVISDQTYINFDEDSIRWYVHGHLGFQLLWSSVAFFAKAAGGAEDFCSEIERGQNKIKYKVLSEHWMSKLNDASTEHPLEFISWIRGPVEPESIFT